MLNKDTQLCISLSGRPSNIGTRFHNYLYQKLNLDFIYKAFTTTDIAAAINGVRALGIRGCSISMPYKESCIPFIDEITPSALAIDSVNTVVNNNGRLVAYNTDFLAIRQLISQQLTDINQQVLVQGSGGMAKAVVAAFYDAGFTQLTITARNVQTGQALAEKYRYQFQPLNKVKAADILVNVTPLGMSGSEESDTLAFPETLVDSAETVFDVVAFPAQTPLINRAIAANKKIISGDRVIALQALEQFVLYTGIRPDESLIKEAALFSRAESS